ncbi:MAG TPA: VWA domain-containing protein [Bryobacteraceae bacterium]|nr:VWA domain-containing protein [Bryobacteraceae bacterium]
MRFVVTLLTLGSILPAQEPSKQAPAPQPVIRTAAQEVLLDVIVRDKKGRAVRDLDVKEIEVYDDGARQNVTGFRLVKGADVVGTAPLGVEQKPYDPMRQLRLVTIIFESLDNESRRLARQAALEFLKNPLDQNVYIAVFMIDQRLYALQQFTNDRELLRKAIVRATTQQYTDFVAQSAAIRVELEQVQKDMEQAPAGNTPGRGNPGGGNTGQAAARMAQMTLNILRYEESLTRDQQARSAIFSLLSVIKEQAALPGRKTVVYFSEGLTIPEAVIEQFRSVIGAANRAGVSVYGVDTRGLISEAMNTSSISMLDSAAKSSARQQSVAGEAVTADQAMVFDTLRDSIHANRQQALDELSTSTGGFLIANTNDYRAPFHKLAEDIDTYYQLSYVPQIAEYDGKFRKIAVKIDRADVKVQTRSGYFALPPSAGAVLAYEMPLLRALEAAPLPRTIPYYAAALRFEKQNEKVEYALVLELPMQDVTFTEDKEKNQYRAHVSLLTLLKNPRGEIVQRFSRDVPIVAPADKLDSFRRGHFTQTYHAELAPGRYTLESAVMDRESMKTSAKRASVVVPVSAASGVRISNLALLRRIEPQGVLADAEDPFHFQGGRVVPTLDSSIQPAGGGELSYYMVVYPAASAADKPQLTMEFLLEGQLVAKATPELPVADARGRIRYVASLPLSSFKPGNYELRAIVRQAGTAAEERASFSINP